MFYALAWVCIGSTHIYSFWGPSFEAFNRVIAI